jgi:hypothetical protein
MKKTVAFFTSLVMLMSCSSVAITSYAKTTENTETEYRYYTHEGEDYVSWYDFTDFSDIVYYELSPSKEIAVTLKESSSIEKVKSEFSAEDVTPLSEYETEKTYNYYFGYKNLVSDIEDKDNTYVLEYSESSGNEINAAGLYSESNVEAVYKINKLHWNNSVWMFRVEDTSTYVTYEDEIGEVIEEHPVYDDRMKLYVYSDSDVELTLDDFDIDINCPPIDLEYEDEVTRKIDGETKSLSEYVLTVQCTYDRESVLYLLNEFSDKVKSLDKVVMVENTLCMNLTANPTYSAYELVENPNKSTSTAEEPKANENVILGDVTGDGKIDSRDAVVILKDFASTILGNKTTLELNKADMNSDGKINSSDAVEVLKTYANSLISK